MPVMQGKVFVFPSPLEGEGRVRGDIRDSRCTPLATVRRISRPREEYAENLTLAAEDININWEAYAERFLRGEFP